jgi:hypothetical protein
MMISRIEVRGEDRGQLRRKRAIEKEEGNREGRMSLEKERCHWRTMDVTRV